MVISGLKIMQAAMRGVPGSMVQHIEQPVPESGAAIRMSVSVVTYNSSFDLLCKTIDAFHAACESVREAGVQLSIQFMVVDNTTDAVYQQRLHHLIYDDAQRRFDRVDMWQSGENIGFGAAHNLALARADSDYHLVLNPDVEMSTDALVVALEYMLRHPDVVVINPQAVNALGQPQYLCKRYPSVLVLLLRAFAPDFLKQQFSAYLHSYEMRDQTQTGTESDVPLASGCCMVTRTEALLAVDGFSDQYFMYFEDFDLSLRLADVGRLVYLPAMQIVHHGGYSARKGWHHISMFVRSGWTFFKRHGWCWI